MTAGNHEATIRGYESREAEVVQRLLLPLDAESRRMLDELVARFYPEHSGRQHNRYRGLVIEIAIRALYQRTLERGAGGSGNSR